MQFHLGIKEKSHIARLDEVSITHEGDLRMGIRRTLYGGEAGHPSLTDVAGPRQNAGELGFVWSLVDPPPSACDWSSRFHRPFS